jgi:hypothetical protein
LALDRAIADVRNPDIELAGRYLLLGSDEVGAHQPMLLSGSSSIPGLLQVRETLAAGDARQACDGLGSLISGLLLNRLMRLTGADAYLFSEDEAGTLDPQGIFFGHTPRITRVQYGEAIIGVDPSDGDVVSVMWVDLTKNLIALVYDLGEDCVQEATA